MKVSQTNREIKFKKKYAQQVWQVYTDVGIQAGCMLAHFSVCVWYFHT